MKLLVLYKQKPFTYHLFSNIILLDLFECFDLVKLTHNIITKEVSRILYKTDSLSRNVQFPDIKLRIDIEDFATYKFIHFCKNAVMVSSSCRHSVQDIMFSNVEYHILSICVKSRLSNQVTSLV